MSKSTKNSVKSERHYGLTVEEVTELKAKHDQTKALPNPHREGAYRFTIDALLNLGANQQHPVAKVHEAFKKVAGEDWYKTWAAKKAGHDADARFLQNLGVLQRTADYGRKLLQVGQQVMGTRGVVLDLTRDEKGELLVALNTDSSKPQKPGRAAKVVAVGMKPQKAPAKPKAKGNGKSPKDGGEAPEGEPEEGGEGKVAAVGHDDPANCGGVVSLTAIASSSAFSPGATHAFKTTASRISRHGRHDDGRLAR